MKQKVIFIGIVILFALIFKQCTKQSDFPVLKGPYLGQTPPGLIAQEFDTGQLTGDLRLFNFSFSPDGNELFFSYNKSTKEKPHPEYEIKYMKRIDNVWNGPETAFFSGTYSDVDITFSPDGAKLYFATERPSPGVDDMDIYYLEKTDNGWSQPKYLEGEVNTPYGEVHAVLSEKRNLFFRSTKPGGYGDGDLYKADKIRQGKTYPNE